MKYRKLIRKTTELRKHTWLAGFPELKGWGYELKEPWKVKQSSVVH